MQQSTPADAAASTPAKIFFGIFTFLLTFAIGLAGGEIVLRLKNMDQKNYNIEMWRYSRLLKIRSQDSVLGHEHRPNSKARLQGVEIRINGLGMRGPEPDLKAAAVKRVLLLGSSNTLGWGVKEDLTEAGLLQKNLGAGYQVLNAGIGNYNARRYVTLFDKKLRALKPDIVVVNYFIRDAEILQPGGGNWLLQNSELAVTLYHFMSSLSFATKPNPNRLVDYYNKIYAADSEGAADMDRAFARLDELSKANHFRVIFTMIPDIHATKPYPFAAIHQRMRKMAEGFGWQSIDFTDVLSRVDQKNLWVMSGDPHINALAHGLIAETLLPAIQQS